MSDSATLTKILGITAEQIADLPAVTASFYGRVILIYQNGKLVRIETEQSYLPRSAKHTSGQD